MNPLNLTINPQPRKLTIEDIKHFPKAELHCHLDGSIRPKTVIDLALEQGVKLDTFDVDELTKLLKVPEDCPDLTVYLRSFDISLKVLQQPYALTRTVYEIAEDAYHDGISYLEIRFAPILHTSNGHTLSEIMHAVVEGRLLAEANFPITVRIIVCAMRQLSPAESLNAVEVVWRYSNQGVVGFDVAGPEFGFMPGNHKDAFELAHRKGLPATIHAGEAAGWESVDEAINVCGAQRIGHGVRMNENPKLVQHVINRRIPVESCPTSNTQTRAVKSMKEHPIREYFDQGMVIFPCTDNTTVSNVTLSQEYLRLHLEKDFTVEELVRMVDYGLSSGFISYTHRTRLRLESMKKILTYLSSQGFNIDGIVHDLPIHDRIFYSICPQQTVPRMYFDSYKNPKITADLIRQLPKVDLHVRLVGGMTLDNLWDLSAKQKGNKMVEEFETKEAVVEYFKNKNQEGSNFELAKARKFMLDVMQSKEQIEIAMDDIFRVSKSENIIFQSLMIRLKDHTMGGLKEEEVIEIVIKSKEENEKKYGIRSDIFLCARLPEDDPFDVMNTAQLILKYRERGVVGFASFGDDLPSHDIQFFQQAFSFMKKNMIPVIISAGRTTPKSVLSAVVDGGAARVSGGYTIHTHPYIVKWLSDRQIPVDLSVTQHMKEHSKRMESFAGNVIRFLYDNDVRVILCSVGRTLEGCPTLDTVIERVVSDCNIKVHELLDLLSFAVRRCLLPFAEKEVLYRDFLAQSHDILEKNGFRHFWKKAVYGDTCIPFPDPHPKLTELTEGSASPSTIPSAAQTEAATPASQAPPVSPHGAQTKSLKVTTPSGKVISVEGGSANMRLAEEQ
ncbi:adenosine deaminase [Monocercomonoides exilis]|uniref:adenosine deaminase n=1 Tax=Monocercomonoides exilis TaxID=2049356 RepID=UPI00355A7064|nr:adenosine deaminase [Monocercomonoides exilis]|eukprot:MONOS_5442.1-p1 / transcript=MONOS_5442.1 / gene=MONOS_5442 / organism=Monocercomonoides_exilis_PA203 / gene_product=adenosine deaminase [EC:3.5.4.4] / transcript_product=adenosine deaminase [EC:3.5.4.4] / location=Mono_scaffold00158:37922-40697(-) / protein_length=840 / sequence_SO=supercontig / SO=protein_coding / is_pseudo=false